MKKCSFLFLFLFPLLIFSQEDPAHFKKGSFGISFSPDLCYRHLTSDAANKWIKTYRNGEEIPKSGFTAGLSFSFFLRDRVALTTGIFFSDKGYRTKKTDLTWTSDNAGFPESAYVVYHHQYIEVPLKAELYISDKRLKIFISAGASANMFIVERSVLKLENAGGDKTKQKSKDFENADMNFAVLAGAGCSYDLTPHFVIKLEPVFRYSLSSTAYDISVKEHLYSAGLNVTVGVHFRDRK